MTSSRNKADVKKLFEYWCEVKRNDDNDVTISSSYGPAGAVPEGIITESFPQTFRDQKTIADIPAFAFPCDFESDAVQTYSFVLTTDESKWRYGFCRHDPRSGKSMVLVTYLPWHDTFFRLLAIMAEIRRLQPADFPTFLNEAYSAGLPSPGAHLTIYYDGGKNQFVIDRPLHFKLPAIPENQNLNKYYNFVPPKNMIGVFAAMLAERRVIFTSRHLDRLSACIQAANAFLYPMVWQHIYIPVMPMRLKDYLSAPMPYLIGVPQKVLDTMTPEELGDVVILNCDTREFISPFEDVLEMPSDIVSQMKKQLSQTQEHMGDRVSRIFLGVLVQLIGGWRDAVEFRGTGKTFNQEKFIESRPSNLRPFLTKMMELQIFQQFIDERLEMLNTGLGFSDEFEKETACYAEKMKRRGRNYAFLKNVKEKTNPAVKSAVKSVKEGSRGMKTAYKDLKSKFRDITPPSMVNTNFRSHLSSNSQHDRIDGFPGVSGGSKSLGRHSAPNSPILSKRSGALKVMGGLVSYQQDNMHPNGAISRRTTPLPLAQSSSHANIPLSNGNGGGGIASASTSYTHLGNHLTSTTPTISPASSLCSSEMNLSQELQNHPLFKSPVVDRSSLRSLQPPKQQEQPAQATSTLDSEGDSTNDLISLGDDSNNASFDLEDFDPLNQNAKPLPTLKIGKKSTTLPAGSTAASMMGNSNGGPMYSLMATKLQQQQPLAQVMTQSLMTTGGTTPAVKPPPLPTSVPPPMPPPDEDFELLRKYGLDQFTLSNGHATSAATTANGTRTTTGMSNWTKFD